MTNPNGQAFVSRRFKYGMVWPAVFIILLIGLFPIVYTAMVSVQNIDMMFEDTSFHGAVHYERLVADARFWQSILHTLIFMAIALPVELILGLLLALLFLDRLPGKQIFIALLILPVVTSPIIAGATWRLLFDNRFGPINQIVSWFTGEPVTILWTVDPAFVYPAILIAEIWQWTPFMFLLLLAGLANVDQSLSEAAELDGAGAPVAADQPPEAGEREHAREIAGRDRPVVVALAGEGEHRVGAALDASVHHAGQMHAEERQARVRHGIDQVPAEVSGLGSQHVVLPAERHDAHPRPRAGEPGEAVVHLSAGARAADWAPTGSRWVIRVVRDPSDDAWRIRRLTWIDLMGRPAPAIPRF